MNKGLYFAYEINETVSGFSFHAIYNREENDFQIGIMIGDVILAVGYTF